MKLKAIRMLMLGALFAVPPSPVGAQSHVYRLNGTLSDLMGGPSLVADGGTLGPSGYTFGPNQGLSLSNVFTSASNYSIAFRSTLFNVSSSTGFVKLLDFKDLSSDNGYYVYHGQSVFYPHNGSGFSTDYVPNVSTVTVLTNDATTHMVTVYVNGLLRLQFADGAQDADFSGPNNIARFFEDDFLLNQPEATGGFVDYIAIYNTVLTDTDVGNLPVVAAPEPASLILVATGLLSMLGAALARKRIAARRLIA